MDYQDGSVAEKEGKEGCKDPAVEGDHGIRKAEAESTGCDGKSRGPGGTPVVQAEPLEALRPNGSQNVPIQGKAARAGVWGKLTETGSTLC